MQSGSSGGARTRGERRELTRTIQREHAASNPAGFSGVRPLADRRPFVENLLSGGD